jgi:hypothetical protein
MRFLDSLDSVRSSPIRADAHMRISLAEIEMKISFLVFGTPIVLSEAQSCDSRAFLKMGPKILASWKRYKLRHLKRHPLRQPMIVGLRQQYPTYLAAVSDFLRNPNFILSGWYDLPAQGDRNELADLLSNHKFKKAIKTFEDVDNQIDSLEVLSRYFETAKKTVGPPRYTLSALYELAVNRGSASDKGTVPRDVGDLLRSVKHRGYDTNSRSLIYTGIRKESSDAKCAYASEAVVDHLYNSVVASSIAETEMVTSAGSPNDFHNDQSALLAMNVLTKDAHGSEEAVLMEQYSPERDKVLRQLTWDKVAEIVAQDNWLHSVARLQNALFGSSEYYESLDRHISDVLAPGLAHCHWTIRCYEKAVDVGVTVLPKKVLTLFLLYFDLGLIELIKEESFDLIQLQLDYLAEMAKKLGTAFDPSVKGLVARDLQRTLKRK